MKAGTWAIGLAALLLPRLVAADYPPGPLSRAHADLEGLTRCTACHVPQARTSGERCLSCHGEIRERIRDRRGLHGRDVARAAYCGKCHLEHKGRFYPLVDWGPRGREGLDHATTGWPLRGKHTAKACGSCHVPKLVTDPAVRAMLAKQPGRSTYLGAPVACASCHRDVHAEQLGKQCATCHTEQGWKPASGFQHAKTSYPLTGAHSKVACEKCHPRDVLRAPGLSPGVTPGDAPWQPEPRYRPVAHDRCDSCHRDPHAAKFAAACATCHSVAGWSEGREGVRKHHAETRYPLQGAHRQTPCKSCHGPFGGATKPRFAGTPFRSCSDCHPDAHGGQIAGSSPPDCARCHDVAAFKPARYDARQHALTRFPLEGAHQTVACQKCHRPDPEVKDAAENRIAAELAVKGRPVRASAARLRYSGDLGRCETCHRDPHEGQFSPALLRDGCARCHTVRSFKERRFDHAWSRFPLEGKHREATCGSCHPVEVSGDHRVTRWRPVPVGCSECHAGVPPGTEVIDLRFIPGKFGAVRFQHAEHASKFRLPDGSPLRCKDCHHQLKADRPTSPVDDLRCSRCHAAVGETEKVFDGKRARALGKLKPDGAVDYTSILFHKQCWACHRKTRSGERITIGCRSCHERGVSGDTMGPRGDGMGGDPPSSSRP